MPKLLIINVTCNQGSTGKISEQVGVMMQERGWEVYLAHGARRVSKSQLHTINFSSKFEEYLHALQTYLFDTDGLGSTRSTRYLCNKIKDINPDLIHIHNIHGYYLNYKILFEYLNSTNIPIIMTLHDCWAFTGHCFHYIIKDCYKWKTECGDCPLQRVYPTRSLLADRSKQNYNLKKNIYDKCKKLYVVAVSDWLAEVTKESMLSNKEIYTIKNGVDLSIFKPLNTARLKSTYDIIAVANMWYRDKGLYDFLKLSHLLKHDERIILVGLDPQKRKIELPANIKAIPHTNSQQELAELYNYADVVVSLSYAETFGLTIAEGAACGTPSIVYDNTAQRSLVTRDTGVVVRTGDVEGVYRAIEEVRRKGKNAYSNACVEYARANLDKNKCYLKYIELYKGVLEM